jgi:hypothetical protein
MIMVHSPHTAFGLIFSPKYVFFFNFGFQSRFIFVVRSCLLFFTCSVHLNQSKPQLKKCWVRSINHR